MKKHRKLTRGMVPAVLAVAVVSATTGQAWAAPAQPGTVKESEKPAAQPGTQKPQEAEPEPAVQQAKPEPAVQEAAPAQLESNPVVAEEPAVAPVREQADEPPVTLVRAQTEKVEITPVREGEDSAVAPEYRQVALTTDLDDSKEPLITEVDEAIRPEEEEEDVEDLPDNNDNNDGDGIDAEVVSEPGSEVVTDQVATELVAEEPTTFSGGAELQGVAVGVEVGVDTTATSTIVSSEAIGFGQEAAGQIETTAVDDQTVEIAVNDYAPVSIETTVTDQSASVTVNDSVPLTIDVPAEAVTAVDQATTSAVVVADDLTAVANEVVESIPDAGDFETQLPAGVTASAWYQAQ